MAELFYILLSVFIVSFVSLIGAAFLINDKKFLKKILIYLVSFSAGALIGDAFIHLIPEAVEENGFSITISVSILFGIVFSFFLEKIIHWRHCHLTATNEHVHSFAIMNLIGEVFHNFIDGIIIAASYLVSVPAGIATTLAVIFHEIPQEMGDIGVLIYGGYSKTKALLLNFLVALTSVLGAIITYLFSQSFNEIAFYLTPFAAGTFIYIAAADLIPELHKEPKILKSIFQLIMFIIGIIVMLGLTFLD